MLSSMILLDRLESIGIIVTPLTWFLSYFTGGTQFVQLKQFRSKPLYVSNGVQQGSFLGPLLFIIYLLTLGNIFRKVAMPMTPKFTCTPNLALLFHLSSQIV